MNNNNDYILSVVKWVVGGLVTLGGMAIAAINKEQIIPVIKTMFGIDIPDDIADDVIEEAKEQIEDMDERKTH